MSPKAIFQALPGSEESQTSYPCWLSVIEGGEVSSRNERCWLQEERLPAASHERTRQKRVPSPGESVAEFNCVMLDMTSPEKSAAVASSRVYDAMPER